MKRWALVAGASRGIGFAATRLLLEDGYSVIVSARDADVLEERYGRLPEERAIILPVDFAFTESLPDYVDRVVSATGGISAMLYAAGMQLTLPLGQSKPGMAEKIFRINAFAAFELIRLFSKKGAYNAGGASFVLLSSLAAHEGAMGKALYGASKGALEGFIPPAAAELVQRGIRLNALALGVVKTAMSAEFLDKMSLETREALNLSYPLGLGEPEDAANFIAFLLSTKSKWITGQIFVADGGHSVAGVR